MPDKRSPAVESLENEGKTNRNQSDTLDVGLEGMFPGSDPVSATTTTTPTVTAKTPGETARDEPLAAPLVDEALQSILEHRNDPYVDVRESAAALGNEVESLKYRGANVADDLRKRVRDRPMQAIGIAALIGFIWGMTR